MATNMDPRYTWCGVPCVLPTLPNPSLSGALRPLPEKLRGALGFHSVVWPLPKHLLEEEKTEEGKPSLPSSSRSGSSVVRARGPRL